MLRRFVRFLSNNALAAGLISTVLGGWLGAKLLTLTLADVGGVLGAVVAWLGSPETVPRVNLIGLALLAFLLGVVMITAIYFRRHYGAATADKQPRELPDLEQLTEWQKSALVVLVNRWPERQSLDDLQLAFKDSSGNTGPHRWTPHKGEIARDMWALDEMGVVQVDGESGGQLYYRLTEPGLNRLLEERERALSMVDKALPAEASPVVEPQAAEAKPVAPVQALVTAPAAPAPPTDPTVPDDFKPTKRQAAAAAVLQRAFPDRLALQDIYSAMLRDDYTLHQSGATRAEVASDLEVLAAAHVVRIESLTDNFAYYHLTKPGRAWLNERSARQRRPARSRPGDY